MGGFGKCNRGNGNSVKIFRIINELRGISKNYQSLIQNRGIYPLEWEGGTKIREVRVMVQSGKDGPGTREMP